MNENTEKLLMLHEYNENNKFIVVLDKKINKLVSAMQDLIKRNEIISKKYNIKQ